MPDKNYQKQVLDDGIVIYRSSSSDREVVDAWFEDVGRVFEAARALNQPVRLVYDVRSIGLATPYSIQRAEELERLNLPDDWRVATLVGNAFLANMVNYIISISMLPDMRARSRAFADEAEALDWLRKS